jgi:hypothetical protein
VGIEELAFGVVFGNTREQRFVKLAFPVVQFVVTHVLALELYCPPS